MNSTFRVRCLVNLEVISQVLFTSEQPKKKQNGFCWYTVTNKFTLCFACDSACVVYTKTIILLSVGESGGYFSSASVKRVPSLNDQSECAKSTVHSFGKFKNWFMLSVRISSYGCTREVWRARKKRKSCSWRRRATLAS